MYSISRQEEEEYQSIQIHLLPLQPIVTVQWSLRCGPTLRPRQLREGFAPVLRLVVLLFGYESILSFAQKNFKKEEKKKIARGPNRSWSRCMWAGNQCMQPTCIRVTSSLTVENATCFPRESRSSRWMSCTDMATPEEIALFRFITDKVGGLAVRILRTLILMELKNMLRMCTCHWSPTHPSTKSYLIPIGWATSRRLSNSKLQE